MQHPNDPLGGSRAFEPPETEAEGSFDRTLADQEDRAATSEPRFSELPGHDLRTADPSEVDAADVLPEAREWAEGVETFSGGPDILEEAHESAQGIESFRQSPAPEGEPSIEQQV